MGEQILKNVLKDKSAFTEIRSLYGWMSLINNELPKQVQLPFQD